MPALESIQYCRECRPSHSRSIKNLKNAFIERSVNLPATASQKEMAILEDYVWKNKVKKSEDLAKLAKMAVEVGKEWQNGRRLTVSFIGGNKQVKDRLIRHAKTWMEYANVEFDFSHKMKVADIRIGFNKNDGSWSFMGTEALTEDSNNPTMNFGWLTPKLNDEEFGAVVLHEFGHALGCIHEHSRPDTGIPWNTKKVYAYYKEKDGWTKEEVDSQVFDKYDRNMIRASAFDKRSIMMYAIPSFLTDGKYQIPFNSFLSSQDKKFIKTIYPFK